VLQRFALTWIANVFALWAAVWLVGEVNVSGFGTLVVAGLVFSLVNLLVKPVVKLLGLPIILLTFGIALFFIDMAMFALTAWIVDDLEVGGFWSVVKGTVVIWLVNFLIGFLPPWRGKREDR
jgi:putative membrane protein